MYVDLSTAEKNEMERRANEAIASKAEEKAVKALLELSNLYKGQWDSPNIDSWIREIESRAFVRKASQANRR